MAVIRVNKTKNYTVMSNCHLSDKNLTLKAKGLLSVMLSLPENWDYSIAGLVSICYEKESAITSTLEELKKNKYLCVKKLMPNQTKSGRIEYLYNIYETPHKEEKQDLEKQDLEKQDLEIQGVEIQDLENQGQLNTKVLNTNKLNTNKENTYNKERNTKEKVLSEIESNFNRFWNEYPKKVGKPNCIKWFEKNKPSDELVDLMISKINEFKDSKQWKKDNGQFIPHPQTWLNRAGWEDQLEASSGSELKGLTQEQINLIMGYN